jgi:hypothetical protein
MMSDRAISRTTFWISLLVHGLAGLYLLRLLIFFVPKFGDLFVRLEKQGELASLTAFVLLMSRYWVWLLGVGFLLDVGVLHTLGRSPKKRRWVAIAWVSFVLIVIVVVSVLLIVGLLLPVQRMSRSL